MQPACSIEVLSYTTHASSLRALSQHCLSAAKLLKLSIDSTNIIEQPRPHDSSIRRPAWFSFPGCPRRCSGLTRRSMRNMRRQFWPANHSCACLRRSPSSFPTASTTSRTCRRMMHTHHSNLWHISLSALLPGRAVLRASHGLPSPVVISNTCKSSILAFVNFSAADVGVTRQAYPASPPFPDHLELTPFQKPWHCARKVPAAAMASH